MLNVPLQAVLLSVVVHLLWGGNPIAAKFGLEVFPPAWSALLRFVFGIATIVLWCWYRRHPIWPKKTEWLAFFKIGVLFTFQIYLMNLGFDNTSGVNAAILISTNPLFAAFFAHMMLGNDKLNAPRIIGLLIAFVGVCLTLMVPSSGNGHFSFGNFGDWLCLVSAGLLGFRLIFSASEMQRIDPFRLTIWQMVFSLPLFLVIAFATETIVWEEFSVAVALGIFYQGIVIAGFGFVASLWLISRYKPSIMAGYNFLAPVSGVFLAAWLLGEALNAWVLLGAALVAIGMILLTVQFDLKKQ